MNANQDIKIEFFCFGAAKSLLCYHCKRWHPYDEDINLNLFERNIIAPIIDPNFKCKMYEPIPDGMITFPPIQNEE